MHDSRGQISSVGGEEQLVINACTHYDASQHRRPADLNADLESLTAAELEPVVNPAGRYAHWLSSDRPAAGATPFALDADGTSFDLDWGLFLSVELQDGRK